MSEEHKTVVVFEARDGQPPLLGDEVKQVDGQPPVCATCPSRVEGLVVRVAIRVPVHVKPDPGSKDAGCKTRKGYPTCFHPDRSTLIEGLDGNEASYLGVSAMDLSAVERFTGGAQTL